jgi:hypothetical protein
LGASEALKIVKNGLKMRKLWPPKLGGGGGGQKKKKKKKTKYWGGGGGGQELKITNHNQFLNTQKLPFMLLHCYYSSKIICRI